MTCPVCRQRKGRRTCPALGATICTICCATKRLVEIRCPEDCPHLVAAREHPAAAVKRQQAEDVSVLLPSINHLSERQRQLFFLFHAQIARHRPEGFNRLVDDDVAQAAASVAATLETAGRGVIYEHTPSSLPAQRLARDLSGLLAETRERGARIYDGEAAIALRAIEHGARDAHKAAAPENAYLTLVARLLHLRGPASGEDREQERPPLIIP